MLKDSLDTLGMGLEKLGPIKYGRLWWLAVSRNFAIIQTISLTPVSCLMIGIWITYWGGGVKTPVHIDMVVLAYPFLTAIILMITMPMLSRGKIWTPMFLNILPFYPIIMFIIFNIELIFNIKHGLFHA